MLALARFRLGCLHPIHKPCSRKDVSRCVDFQSGARPQGGSAWATGIDGESGSGQSARGRQVRHSGHILRSTGQAIKLLHAEPVAEIEFGGMVRVSDTNRRPWFRTSSATPEEPESRSREGQPNSILRQSIPVT